MKVSFWEKTKNKGQTTYTDQLLPYLARSYGHKIVDVNDSDILLVSLTSHYEMGELRKARRKYPKKKIVVGGHCSNAPLSLLAYADYVNLGAGFDFFKKIKKISDLESASFIIHKDKLEGEYSQFIDWERLPVVQISKNSYSYLESVGCPNKCRFCVTSWLNKHQKNPKRGLIRRIAEKYHKKQLYLITNNFEGLEDYGKLNVIDVTVKNYIQNPLKYQKFQLIRVGMESPTERARKFFNKPLSDEEIKAFFEITSKYKKRTKIFMMPGLDTQEEWENFIEQMPIAPLENKPQIGFVLNYFDPSMGTPLARWDLTKLIPLNIPKIKNKWKLHNARVVIYFDFVLSWKHSTIDSLLQRCIWKDTERIWAYKKKKFNTYREMLDTLRKDGFESLINGKFKYNVKLKNWYGDVDLWRKVA